ncbi:hypothetical protein ABOM_010098 [Aspergillus bombycis]|uniref:HRQ family protein n=1 Tax=Aspergillus bombycis TaxID=109264 RepID=A0A1F7ZPT6_9EURO|nr:hypothetical protein ABOM_010098 [Aspergillus bombycis]OGM41451.1 hypothetical protein ABOM_010098 [Aspergillus bombycis]
MDALDRLDNLWLPPRWGPPQSISPEKRTAQCADVLPPQSRQALTAVPGFATGINEVCEEKVLKHILPMTTDYRSCEEDKYTPTGFSIAEINALGDFPDYAKLSGVPLPQEYLEFEIKKALPRPYRPFRWGYHQTMSLTKLETDWWIELENTYEQRIAQRKELYAKYGDAVLGWLPGSELACKELMEMVLQFICSRFFTKMPTDKPIQRGSWGLEVGQPLYMPKGDPHEKLRLYQDPNLQLDDCYLRVDWQTLRRLPLSGAIVFNFKALFTPVTEFRDEPGVPALVTKVLKEGRRNIMKYKNTWHVEHVILPKLEAWAKEQEENGLVPKGWEVATLDDSPWYQSWQKKWHRQQGF